MPVKPVPSAIGGLVMGWMLQQLGLELRVWWL